MPVFKCKMCGGNLQTNDKMLVGTCSSCGSTMTIPRLEGDRLENLYIRANELRRAGEFDKAEAIYEQILNENRTDSEAYWSLVLCKFGVEYVEDPKTRQRVPTCSRTQFTPITVDENYKQALAYADVSARALYEAEAKAIDEIQKGILAISAAEQPFDVFISYKEVDSAGKRTPDSVLAQDLYYQLTQEGFKVFFSRITLEDKLGSAYEPYIFAALNSAKVMVAIGTKPEYFNAVWVRNEWSRYLSLIKTGHKKTLIPAYKDMDPYYLPEEFSNLQAQDMTKLGFMQDLIRGIKKIVAENKTAPVSQPYYPQQGGYKPPAQAATPKPFTPYPKPVNKPDIQIPPKIKKRLPILIGIGIIVLIAFVSISSQLGNTKSNNYYNSYTGYTNAHTMQQYTRNYDTTKYEDLTKETAPPSAFKPTGEKVKIPFDNPTVTIESAAANGIPAGQGKLVVQLLGGGTPLIGEQIYFYSAVLNIANQWAIENNTGSFDTDESGFVTADLPAGDYTVMFGRGERFGTYGIIGKYNNEDMQMIPVTVKAGQAVFITVSLAQLNVGVLSADGMSALSNESVYVYPQAADIAGNPIPMDGYGNESIRSTAAGTAIWYLGAGVYTAKCYDNELSDYKYQYGISVTAGAKSEITFKISKSGW